MILQLYSDKLISILSNIDFTILFIRFYDLQSHISIWRFY